MAHILPLREYILDENNNGKYINVMRDVLRRMLGSQRAITVPLEPFLVEGSFYMFHNGGERE